MVVVTLEQFALLVLAICVAAQAVLIVNAHKRIQKLESKR